MVNVGDTRHGDEGEVMQGPADGRVQSGVVNVVDFSGLEVVETALPPEKVPDYEETDGAERRGRAPVDERVAEQEVFDNVVVPAAHAQADVQDRPLPELRGQVVLLIWVRDQGVVGCHHGDVQVDEVLEERRLVRSSIGSRDYRIVSR